MYYFIKKTNNQHLKLLLLSKKFLFCIENIFEQIHTLMKNKKRENRIYHSHDKLFKATFQDIDAAIDCVKYLLPPKIAKQIDLNNFTRDETHYVTRFLKEFMTDVVYNASQTGSDGKIALALLWEHKSNPEENICVQLHNYISARWQRDMMLNRPLTAVIPIVFYHGEDKWGKKSYWIASQVCRRICIPTFLILTTT